MNPSSVNPEPALQTHWMQTGAGPGQCRVMSTILTRTSPTSEYSVSVREVGQRLE